MPEDLSKYIDLGDEDSPEARVYATIFDSFGFEGIVDLTEMEDNLVIEKLQGNTDAKSKAAQTIFAMSMRARFNSQRSAEAWAFKSTNSEEDLWLVSQEAPQELANLIRKKGVPVFTTRDNEREPLSGPVIL